MSVRNAILAILDQGACYGNQLRSELQRRTGGAWVVNVGQIYATLERLERDGLAVKGAPDAAGHIPWSITREGAEHARAWLTTPVDPAEASRDELGVKIALALSLEGADAASLISAQRATTTAAAARLRAESLALRASDSARALVLDLAVAISEAELEWLDHCEAALPTIAPLALEAELPRRGRPTRAS